MPTAIDSLPKNADKKQVRGAVSSCIATEIRHGKSPDEAAGMCYSMAREAGFGHHLPKKVQVVRRKKK